MKKAEKIERVKLYLSNVKEDELWCNDTLWLYLVGYEPTLTLKDTFNLIQAERKNRIDAYNK